MRYVRLAVLTSWRGKRLRPGDELYVPQDVASRWERNRIADVLDSDFAPPDSPDAAETPSLPTSEADVDADTAEYTVVRVGTSSWYDLMRGSELVERVNGASAANKRVRELSGE